MNSCCNNINCICNNTCNPCNKPDDGLLGVRKITRSHFIQENKFRAVFYKNGGCDIIPKGYIPAVKSSTTTNGPQLKGYLWGNDPAPESEGMDCLNYMFNRNRYG
jgi:hypothetical protein